MEKAHELSKEKRTADVSIDEDITFEDMLLSKRTLKGLEAAGFVKPSPIQVKAIPYGRCGFDLIVQAKSGTGKTCVFTVIAMEMLVPSLEKLQVVVLAPTREISVQISNVMSSISSCIGDIKVEPFIGGLPFEEDKKKIVGCQIAVGAPGRMKHLISSDLMDLTAVRLFVLDEADRLMEESFRSDISYIFSKLPLNKQIIAVSATFPEELEKFVAEFMNKPIRVSPSQDPILLGVRQFAYSIEYSSSGFTQMRNKVAALREILSRISFKQCLVFSNYQSWAENICKEITKEGWPAIFIHGAQKQPDRLKAFESLKQNRCRVFFSTDLTSRGIDVENVNLVVNLDLPYDCATYVHRVGRAGRYGTYGKAVTLVQEGEEVEIFRKLLYNVGGSHFHVYQFPKEDLLLNIWEANDEQFEKLSGLFGEYKFERKKFPDAGARYKEDDMAMKKENAVEIINKYRLQPPEVMELSTWESLTEDFENFVIDDTKNNPVEDATSTETIQPVPETVLNSILCLENDGWNSFYKEFKSFKQEEDGTETEEVAVGGQEDDKDLPDSDEPNDSNDAPVEDKNPDSSDGNLAGFSELEIGDTTEDESGAVNLEMHPGYNRVMHNWFNMWYEQCRIIRDYVQYYNFWRNNL